MFHEGWYSDEQCALLSVLIKKVMDLEGKFIEIGCWEGKSTTAIANSCYPQNLDAVDTWQGNIDENPNHPTIAIAKERDVFGEFQTNIKELTKGNVTPFKVDCFLYLTNLKEKVKFCHIDASHDYASVRRTIEMLIPWLVPGAILCGDDYRTAHAGRDDLGGGVEKAVSDMCPGHVVDGNSWYWQKNI